jgi:hypothetical protein
MKESQLLMLESIFPQVKEIYPKAKLKLDEDENSDNFGNHFIGTMEDTEIRYNDYGFSIFDYHNEDAPVEYYKYAEDIVNYLRGFEDAYGVPMIKEGDNYFFCKGYFDTMTRLMEYLKEDLLEHQKALFKNN